MSVDLSTQTQGMQQPIEKKFTEMWGVSALSCFFHFDIICPLITHISFNLTTQARDMQQPIEKKFHKILRLFQITRKLLIAQILERWLLVGKKVPYKFPNDIALKLSTLHAVN